MTVVFNAFLSSDVSMERFSRSKSMQLKAKMHQGSFKASARRARRAIATGTVSPLAIICEFLRIKQNKTGFNDELGSPRFDIS